MAGNISVARGQNGRWAVILVETGAVLSEHDTNARAWRAADLASNEPLNKRQAVAEWAFNQIPTDPLDRILLQGMIDKHGRG